MSDKLIKYDNGMVPIPGDRIGIAFNGGCPDACDMYIGPCACGAWHHVRDWSDDIIIDLGLIGCGDDLEKYPLMGGWRGDKR